MAAATARMGDRRYQTYRPRTRARRAYETLYREYLDLARHFGEGGSEVMRRLRALRADVRETRHTGEEIAQDRKGGGDGG
jgi:L-ribulokinase